MGRQFILAIFPSGSAIKPESIIVFWQLVLRVPYLECVGYSAGESKPNRQLFDVNICKRKDFGMEKLLPLIFAIQR